VNSAAGVCSSVLHSLDDSAILKLENEIGRKRGSRLKLDWAQNSVLRFFPIENHEKSVKAASTVS